MAPPRPAPFPGMARLAVLLRLGGSRALDLALPRRCFGCDLPREDPEPSLPCLDTWLCRACQDSLPLIQPPLCSVCGEPFPGDLTRDFRCWNCDGRAFDFEFAVSGYRAEGLVRDLIHGFKYDSRYELRGLLAVLLRQALQDSRLLQEPGLSSWLLVPVPLHPWREMTRGYNQSWEICLHLSRATGIPAQKILRRLRRTTSQAGLDRSRRLKNLRGAFALRPGADVRGRRILLVDDVLTTGSTCQECARILRHEGGAEKVVVITTARG
jgi:competence protein ComFC